MYWILFLKQYCINELFAAIGAPVKRIMRAPVVLVLVDSENPAIFRAIDFNVEFRCRILVGF